jgi:transcriptional regulator with XRE-family HTH domain
MTHRRKDRTARLIAGRITNARLQAGFTKKALAGALGVDGITYRKWERADMTDQLTMKRL